MSHFANAPLLLDTLSSLLPDKAETLFLKVCLGVDTERSWRDWRVGEPELKTLIAGAPACKRLLPLLFFTLTREGVSLAQGDLALLRVAAVWEERRASKVDALLVDILGALRENAIEPVVLKGVALAHLAYPKPSLRHCHDVDLLVERHQFGKAVEAVSRVRFAMKQTEGAEGDRLVLLHRGGLPVSIHADLLPGAAPSPSCEATPARTVRAALAGVSALVLDPADLLLFMSAQLLAGRVRYRTSWVVDAVFLLRRMREDEIDWTELAEQAGDRGLALVLLAMLAYLNAEFGVAIPEPALAHLGERARQKPEVRDRLLFLLRRNPGVSASRMFRDSGWRSRLDMLRWTVFPTTAYLQSWCRERGLRWSPAWYVLRPLRRLSMQVRPASGTAHTAPDGEDFP